ncbi:hypothetical protein PR048_016663 [Dryococelus australis]|uniref:Uncharacterized protein n=1 Tax=Dryococelus australis TaxID=614101 RepID=A0ABQ9H7G7_9NEOP|nr:hypothetical protein PR048_016663 [Dryococelus australis]
MIHHGGIHGRTHSSLKASIVEWFCEDVNLLDILHLLFTSYNHGVHHTTHMKTVGIKDHYLLQTVYKVEEISQGHALVTMLAFHETRACLPKVVNQIEALKYTGCQDLPLRTKDLLSCRLYDHEI